MKNNLWQHQKDAIAFADGKNAVMVACDMGTGKCRIAMELIIDRKHKFTVVLCPKAVCPVWPEEFNKHYPDSKIKVIALQGTTSEKGLQFVQEEHANKDGLIIVTNYESVICRKDKWGNEKPNPLNAVLMAAAREGRIDCMILDESHRIKSVDSTISWLCKDFGRFIKHKLCLTGTPFHHSPLDIYGQYRFLDRTIFPPFFRTFKFHYAYVDTGRKGQPILGFKNLGDLHDKFYQIAFRVNAEDVLDLPGETHQIRHFSLGREARRIYDDIEANFEAELVGGRITVSNALVWFMRLQQITSGFCVPDFDDGERIERIIGREKQKILIDLLNDLDVDEPLVVFCRFRHDLDSIHTAVRKAKFDSAELSGRVNQLEEWKSPGGPKVLAVQIRSGKEGIDLTRARYGVYYSHGLSYGDYAQSLRRIRRPGQERTVFYIHLVAEDSIDQRIMTGLKKKGQLVRSILEGYVKK